VGILGASVGIHRSLGLSAAALFVTIAAMFAARYRRGRREEEG
jgi:biopolymer transport protein ExbB/TolQ